MSISVDRELAQYVHRWKFQKSQEQVVEEIASYGHETRRIPDSYYFYIDTKTGKLLASASMEPVEKFIDKDSPLGMLEYEGFRKTQSWAEVAPQGTVSVWFSPPLPGTCNVSKLIISEKTKKDGKDALLNHAVLFDATEEHCKTIVQSFAREWNIDPSFFDVTNVIRANPIMLTCDVHMCVNILAKYIRDDEGWKAITSRTSLKTKMDSLFLARRFFDKYVATPDYYKLQAYLQSDEKDELFGEHEGSCPTGTAFSVLFGAKILCCTCPYCLNQVEALILEGVIYCPHCKRSAPLNN